MHIRILTFWALLLSASITAGPSVQAQDWRAVQTLTIGSADDSLYTFTRIVGVAKDSLGTIYVADGSDLRIRVYSPTGVHLRDIGRPGEGPGEFRVLQGLGLLGDTIYTSDATLNRLTFFDKTGRVLRTEPGKIQVGGEFPRTLAPTALYSGGRGIAVVIVPATTGRKTLEYPRLLVTRTGHVLDTIGVYKTQPMVELPATHGLRMAMPDPFGKPVLMPLSMSAGTWAEVFLPPDADLKPGQFRVSMMRVGGRETWHKRIATEPIRFTSEDIDSTIARTARSTQHRVTEEVLRQRLTPPKFRYPVGAAVLSDKGDLWLRLARETKGLASWLVLDSAGNVAGRIQLPIRALPRLVSGDQVLAITTDDYDTQYVVEYRIIRGLSH